MDEDGIRAFLHSRLRPNSVSSYMSNLRRVEGTLGVQLETCDLSSTGLVGLESRLRLRANQFTRGSLSDCVSALRAYADFHTGRRRAVVTRQQRTLTPPMTTPSEPPRHTAITGSSVLELLTLHSQVIDELRDRQIVRTGNSPVGDYAECLFAKAFGWELQPNSSSGYDASKDGIRYQVKSRRITPKSPSRQLGALRRIPEKTFDVLAAVLFDGSCQVLRAILIPHELVTQYAKRVEHTNSWRLMLEDWWWSVPGTQDVTQAVRSAASSFDRDHHLPFSGTDQGDPNPAQRVRPLLAKVSSLLRRS